MASQAIGGIAGASGSDGGMHADLKKIQLNSLLDKTGPLSLNTDYVVDGTWTDMRFEESQGGAFYNQNGAPVTSSQRFVTYMLANPNGKDVRDIREGRVFMIGKFFVQDAGEAAPHAIKESDGIYLSSSPITDFKFMIGGRDFQSKIDGSSPDYALVSEIDNLASDNRINPNRLGYWRLNPDKNDHSLATNGDYIKWARDLLYEKDGFFEYVIPLTKFIPLIHGGLSSTARLDFELQLDDISNMVTFTKDKLDALGTDAPPTVTFSLFNLVVDMKNVQPNDLIRSLHANRHMASEANLGRTAPYSCLSTEIVQNKINVPIDTSFARIEIPGNTRRCAIFFTNNENVRNMTKVKTAFNIAKVKSVSAKKKGDSSSSSLNNQYYEITRTTNVPQAQYRNAIRLHRNMQNILNGTINPSPMHPVTIYDTDKFLWDIEEDTKGNQMILMSFVAHPDGTLSSNEVDMATTGIIAIEIIFSTEGYSQEDLTNINKERTLYVLSQTNKVSKYSNNGDTNGTNFSIAHETTFMMPQDVGLTNIGKFEGM